MPGRLLRRVITVLFWGGVLALGTFGAIFSFANYPLFGIGIVLVILLLITHSERKRRRRQSVRERYRTRRRDLSSG